LTRFSPQTRFKAVVLAGERPGGSDFSRELGLAASVLVDVAGKTSIARVIETLELSARVDGGVLCGPSESVYLDNPEFQKILNNSSFNWLAPESGPSASAVAAVKHIDRFPVLLTAGDHALLTPTLVDDFCSGAMETEADIVFGVTPYALVKAAYPESKRTVSKFSDGQYCGTNLFALLTPKAAAGPLFWSQVEADRKRPWRIARRFGVGILLRYLLGRLSLKDALDTLAATVGCKVGHVVIENPRVAVDVDSIADRDLANKILLVERGAGPNL
jgi:GTP:adenosylcobinamide-phosphate guanylyltransferase